ncbi:MAG: DNA repair protein RadC [Rickettsiaceae bacterium]|nr:DNA repair protein RadC [Rickettsiaceae bacterium]
MSQDNPEQPHYLGHRRRLKEKFLKNPNSFSDYELLELLLFQAIPRKDVKPLSKTLLKKFKNFRGLVNASHDHLMSANASGVTQSVYFQFQLLRELLNRMFREEVFDEHVISSWTALLNYLKFNMGCMKIEQFRVLFLNNKNILLADEILANGTIDQTPVYPREIVKRILFYEAASIILVHNHPSGNIKPSPSDIALTEQIIMACKTVNVKVHDHVIIGGNNYFSFKSNMLL